MARLEQYKTAYARFYKKFVKILYVERDATGEATIYCNMDGHTVTFRSWELDRYCL
jgi:uncharacterized protein YaaW (UPF0174 family)